MTNQRSAMVGTRQSKKLGRCNVEATLNMIGSTYGENSYVTSKHIPKSKNVKGKESKICHRFLLRVCIMRLKRVQMTWFLGVHAMNLGNPFCRQKDGCKLDIEI